MKNHTDHKDHAIRKGQPAEPSGWRGRRGSCGSFIPAVEGGEERGRTGGDWVEGAWL